MNLDEQYKKIAKKRNNIFEQINILSEDEKVKLYLNLKNKNYLLEKELFELYKQRKIEKYKTCKHILVNTICDYDEIEGKTYYYSGCIKCGLDEKVLYLTDRFDSKYNFSSEQQIMYEYRNDLNYLSGNKTDIKCDLELASAIYKKIKESQPNINDIIALKYLKAALFNIKTKQVNNNRKKNRIKRLSLKMDYKWKNISLPNKKELN